MNLGETIFSRCWVDLSCSAWHPQESLCCDIYYLHRIVLSIASSRLLGLFSLDVTRGKLMGCVLVHSGCYNRLPSAEWLISNLNLFITVLEAEVQDQGATRSGAW